MTKALASERAASLKRMKKIGAEVDELESAVAKVKAKLEREQITCNAVVAFCDRLDIPVGDN